MFYELTDSFVVKSDLQQTWDFFSRAENLPRITPKWMGFEIKTPQPIEIRQDSILDYTIRWMGIPIGWRTRIIDWSPPRQFIDLQLRGPYAVWHHQHTFSASEEGTLCTDRVLYKIPGGPIGILMNQLVVRRQLIEVFEFRRKVITEDLGWVRAIQKRVEVKSVG
jgi:ligand-binding SRPBCC domain-containing protein